MKAVALISIIAFAGFLFMIRKGFYYQFHKTRIKGTIDSVYYYKGYFMIYVDSVEYRIIPLPLKWTPEFTVASKGDSLIKLADSDTLTLKTRHETFRYVVQTY